MSVIQFKRTVSGRFYMFLVSTREIDKWENPKTGIVENREYWLHRDAIRACDMHEVAGKLRRDLEDVRFESKSVVR